MKIFYFAKLLINVNIIFNWQFFLKEANNKDKMQPLTKAFPPEQANEIFY